MQTAIWSCGCGAVAATVPVEGSRLVCYCESCRGFVERLGAEDRLDDAGGNHLIQVTPSQVTLIKGSEKIRWMKMSQKGPMRWYAACCNTPMANTLSTRAVAFASFQTHDIAPQDALPEVSARVHLKGALAHVEGPRGGVGPLMRALLGRTLKSWVSGTWRRHPFFDAAGHPIAAQEEPASSTG